ncbi:MAG: PIN domain-containing protein [Desulfobacteraceae bacterium]|nr:PIN domain-containing protein [Desulfobacteraceae bacterium]
MAQRNSRPAIFLDANILFSAAYGSPAVKRLQEKAKSNECSLLASEYVIEEARRNLDTKEQITALKNVLSQVRVVREAAPEISCPISLPSKDRPVFMAAMMAQADYLVTGDLIHFGLYFGKTIQGVTICQLKDLK